MADYITIDGGTTNTRISLVENNAVIDTIKFNIGAKKGIDDNSILKTTIKNGIEEILKKNKKKSCEIESIIASGMITSEYGLIELKHIIAPAGLNELHNGIYKTYLTEISDIQFAFIPGIKTNTTNFEDADMMRGEETEIMGLTEKYGKNGIYILPGSHSKIIAFDDKERISIIKTMLTGEMIYALASNTILKDCIDLSVNEFSPEYLIKGYEYSLEVGINSALFKVRILNNLFNHSEIEIYSFFLGVILSSEISVIKNSGFKKAIIGGKEILKQATAHILKEKTDIDVIVTQNSDTENCVALGAVKIYEV